MTVALTPTVRKLYLARQGGSDHYFVQTSEHLNEPPSDANFVLKVYAIEHGGKALSVLIM